MSGYMIVTHSAREKFRHTLDHGFAYVLALPGTNCVLVVAEDHLLDEWRPIMAAKAALEVRMLRDPTPEEAASGEIVDLREPL